MKPGEEKRRRERPKLTPPLPRDSAANQDQTNPSDAKWDTVVDSGRPPAAQCTHARGLELTTVSPRTVVDEVANKEGVSAALDPEINNFVNDEVNKF